jgi:hypothetical protein
MKTIKLLSIISLSYLSTILISCTENPRDEDPASTITPGQNLHVDSLTAHANNSTDTAISHENNKMPGTKGSNIAAPLTTTVDAKLDSLKK